VLSTLVLVVVVATSVTLVREFRASPALSGQPVAGARPLLGASPTLANSPLAHPSVVPNAPADLDLSSNWADQHPDAKIDFHGLAGILVDVDAREILWLRDAQTQRPPASLAKLVTGMVAYERAGSLDKTVTVTPQTDMDAEKAIEPEATLMGIKAGQVLTVHELLTGLFVVSGNDAAETLATGLGPRDDFIAAMNAKAAKLGMKNSHFTTPVGLDAPGMRSSAYDLALAAMAIETHYPDLVQLASIPEMHLPANAGHPAFDANNWLHRFLTTYAGAKGIKTGNTDEAGPCIAATAARGNRHLLAVVMHSNVMVDDAERLLDYGFSVQPSQRSP